MTRSLRAGKGKGKGADDEKYTTCQWCLYPWNLGRFYYCKKCWELIPQKSRVREDSRHEMRRRQAERPGFDEYENPPERPSTNGKADVPKPRKSRKPKTDDSPEELVEGQTSLNQNFRSSRSDGKGSSCDVIRMDLTTDEHEKCEDAQKILEKAIIHTSIVGCKNKPDWFQEMCADQASMPYNLLLDILFNRKIVPKWLHEIWTIYDQGQIPGHLTQEYLGVLGCGCRRPSEECPIAKPGHPTFKVEHLNQDALQWSESQRKVVNEIMNATRVDISFPPWWLYNAIIYPEAAENMIIRLLIKDKVPPVWLSRLWKSTDIILPEHLRLPYDEQDSSEVTGQEIQEMIDVFEVFQGDVVVPPLTETELKGDPVKKHTDFMLLAWQVRGRLKSSIDSKMRPSKSGSRVPKRLLLFRRISTGSRPIRRIYG